MNSAPKRVTDLNVVLLPLPDTAPITTGGGEDRNESLELDIEAAALLGEFFPETVSDSDESGNQVHSISMTEEGSVAEAASPAESSPITDPGESVVVLDASVADSRSVGVVVEALLSRLDSAEEELQSSSMRIGELQAEIDRYRDKLKLLPDFEAQARKAAEIEQQNIQLRQHLPELELRAKRLVALQQENAELRAKLEEKYAPRPSRWQLGSIFSLEFWRDRSHR